MINEQLKIISQTQNTNQLQQLLDAFTGFVTARHAHGQSTEKFTSTFFKTSLKHRDLNQEDSFLLTAALIPHFAPAFYDQLFVGIFGEGNFPDLGGTRGKQHRGILLTGEMALYLYHKDDLPHRQHLYQYWFNDRHWLFKEKILSLESALPGEPRLSGKLLMAQEYVELFLTGKLGKTDLGEDFPSQKISTQQAWEDLVLHPHTRVQVEDLEAWLNYGDRLLDDWGLARRVKPGYRVLFFGPPGTGKTLTASLLGKHTNRAVYRIDLSMLVSKYIGETEKNLARLFDKAENKNWILFFDEADALFHQRTAAQNANTQYANQQVSYLLQRIEDYNGLVILASNYKDNIDNAFLRRFQSIISFPLPRAGERLRLWQRSLPSAIELTPDVDLKAVSDRYELSGADIVNIVHYVCLRAMTEERYAINSGQLNAGIERELTKLGKKRVRP